MNKKLKVLDYLDEIESILDNASVVPFTGKIMFERKELIDIIENITRELPEEYQHVKYAYENTEEILTNAEKDAATILLNAQNEEEQILKNIENKKSELSDQISKEHDRLLNDHHIVLEAKSKAEMIIEEAKLKARDMRISSFEYSHKMLLSLHGDMSEQLDIVEKNIVELNKLK